LHRIAFSLGLAVVCATTHAEQVISAAPRFELDALSQQTSRPALFADALPGAESMPLANASASVAGVSARWWVGRGRFELGAGADWEAPSPRTLVGAGSAGALRPRFALEFRAKAATKDLRDGLLRVQMSGDAALHFRPRSRGLQITYRERF
jgi:hypothetical protein